MDRLAVESVVYEDAFSPAPWTAPSHASMLTGLYPVSHGCSYEHHVWLDDSFATVQEHLAEEGYQTLALSSNWWLEEANILQGFDQVISLKGGYDYLATKRLAYSLGWPARWVDKGSGEGIEALKRWLTRERDAERPMFLFVNLFEAHAEYVPPAETRDIVTRRGIEMGPALRSALRCNPSLTNVEKRDDPELIRALSALYDAEIQYQDRRLGDILQLLRQHIQFDNTLIIVTADHGENLGEAGRWDHVFAINDILLHVPLVIRYPNERWAGTRVAGFCQLVDLFSTILTVAGVSEEGKETAARSLVPDAFEPRRVAFAQVSPYYPFLRFVEQARGLAAGMADFVAHYRAIRTPQYKYVWSSTGNHALYDVQRDPWETVNLLPRAGEIATTLQNELLGWWAQQPAYELNESDHTPQPMDPRTLERLRSIGYVD
jgi:arylsulfatase A-like enzyme